MVDTILQDENMTFAIVVDEMYLDGSFLDWWPCTICCGKTSIRLLESTRDEFEEVVTDVSSSGVVTYKKY